MRVEVLQVSLPLLAPGMHVRIIHHKPKTVQPLPENTYPWWERIPKPEECLAIRREAYIELATRREGFQGLAGV